MTENIFSTDLTFENFYY